MPPRPVGLAILLALAAPAAAQPQAIPAEQLARIKAATVYIKVDDGDGGGATGSGFLARVDGKTGWVVTNNHVVELPMVEKPAVELVFASGSPGEWTVKAEVIGRDPDRDLAVLKVAAVKPLPEPLSLTGPDKVTETMPVYVCGFPFGDRLTVAKKNPEISIGAASVSSVRTGAGGEMVTIQLNGALNPGNSGGPVVATDGKLVGVAVRTVRGAGIGEAVPHPMVADLFRGRVTEAGLFQSRFWVESKQTRFDARVIDPLGRVKAVRGHVAPAGKDEKEAAPADVSKVEGAAAYDLETGDDVPTGFVRAPMPLPEKPAHVWVQATWADADGAAHRTPARRVKVLRTDADFDAAEAGPPQPGAKPKPAPKPDPDPGVTGLTGPDGKALPPLATRLPATPNGQVDLFDLRNRAEQLLGKTVTVDLLTSGVVPAAAGAGPMLTAADRSGAAVRELDFLIDTPTAAALAALKLEGPPARKVTARVRGAVKASPTTAYRVAVVVDELVLLDTAGGVAARLTFAADESAKLLADMAASPAGWVGSPCECRMAVSGVTEELIRTGDGPRKAGRLVFTTTAGKPVAGVKVYLADSLAAATAAAHKQHGGGLQNAVVEFRPLRVDRATGELVCVASQVKLYAAGWKEVRWSGSGEIKDPDPDPVLSPPTVPVAAPPAAPLQPPLPSQEPGAATPQVVPPSAPPQQSDAASDGNTAKVFALGVGAGAVLLGSGALIVWLASRGRTAGRGRRKTPPRRRDSEEDDEDVDEDDDDTPRRRR